MDIYHESKFAKVMGRLIDNRSFLNDLKDIRSIYFDAEVSLGTSIKYKIKLILVPGILPRVCVMHDVNSDAEAFIKEFPYSYDSAGLTWVPIGYSIDVAYKKLESLSQSESEVYNFKCEVLNLLHKSAIDEFTSYFKDHDLGIFVLSPLTNGYWDVFYTGHIQHKIGAKSQRNQHFCDGECSIDNPIYSDDFFCDVRLGKVKGYDCSDVIKKLQLALNSSNRGPVKLPSNIESHKYSTIQRKLLRHK